MTVAADRRIPTAGPLSGADIFADANAEIASLNNRSICFLTNVLGMNNLTADCDPPLDGYVKGQSYIVVPPFTNTGAMKLNIGGRGNKDWRDLDGNDLAAGAVVGGRAHLINYDGTKFRMLFSTTTLTGGVFAGRGSWKTATNYNVFDVAERGGSSYLCIVAHTSDSSTRPTDGVDWEDVWMLFAEKGDTGATGTVANAVTPQPTIDAMVGLTKADLVDGQLFQVAAYDTPGDSGGGLFYWDAASTEAEDLGLIWKNVAAGAGRYKRVWEPSYSPTYWGTKFSGDDSDASANLAALNAMIAAINAALIQNVQFPAGSAYLDDEPDAITASNLNIFGSAQGTKLIMASGAGAAGRFFKFGNASTRAEFITLSGFSFDYENFAGFTGNSAHNAIVLANLGTGFFDNFEFDNANGFCKLGDSADDTQANRAKFSRVHGRCRANNPSVAIDIQNSGGHSFNNVTITGMSGTVSGYIDIHIHPVDGSVLDGGGFFDCEFNHVTVTRPDFGLLMDATDGILTNQIFVNVVLDHLMLAAIKLLIDTGAAANARLSNAEFIGCRGTGNGANGNGMALSNPGNAPMRSIRFIGGILQSETSYAVDIHGDHPVDVLFQGTGFADIGNLVDRPAVRADAGSGLRVQGCYLGVITEDDVCHFTWGVAFTGAHRASIITGNDFRNASIGTVDPTNISADNAADHVWGQNLGAPSEGTFKLHTASVTPVLAMSITLEDQCVYTAEVRLDWLRTDGVVAGSQILVATGKKFGGGASAVDSGTLYDSGSTPLAVGYAASMMQFTITPPSSSNFWWSLELVHLKRVLIQ